MDCDNCDKKLEGIGYRQGSKFFCGKSCLVKHLKDIGFIKMELFGIEKYSKAVLQRG